MTGCCWEGAAAPFAAVESVRGFGGGAPWPLGSCTGGSSGAGAGGEIWPPGGNGLGRNVLPPLPRADHCTRRHRGGPAATVCSRGAGPLTRLPAKAGGVGTVIWTPAGKVACPRGGGTLTGHVAGSESWEMLPLARPTLAWSVLLSINRRGLLEGGLCPSPRRVLVLASGGQPRGRALLGAWALGGVWPAPRRPRAELDAGAHLTRVSAPGQRPEHQPRRARGSWSSWHGAWVRGPRRGRDVVSGLEAGWAPQPGPSGPPGTGGARGGQARRPRAPELGLGLLSCLLHFPPERVGAVVSSSLFRGACSFSVNISHAHLSNRRSECGVPCSGNPQRPKPLRTQEL